MFAGPYTNNISYNFNVYTHVTVFKVQCFHLVCQITKFCIICMLSEICFDVSLFYLGSDWLVVMLYRPPSIYVSKATTQQENCSLWSMCIAKSFVHSVQALYYIYTGVQAAYYCNNYNTMFLHLQHFQKSYDKKQKKKVFCNYHYLKKETIIKKKKN